MSESSPTSSESPYRSRVDKMLESLQVNFPNVKRRILRDQILSLLDEVQRGPAAPHEPTSDEANARRHLEVIRDFREEVRLLNVLQEDLRRERAVFFTQTVREVAQQLREANVAETAAAAWLDELVRCYTASLDVSAEFLRTAGFDRLAPPSPPTKSNAP